MNFSDLLPKEQMITIGCSCARFKLLIPNERETKIELNPIKNSKCIFLT